MWSPIALHELHVLIRESELEMSPAERQMWSLLRIPPVKWALHPWGDEGGGFWAVGLIGHLVIWYNDIEDGFNVSSYNEPGTIVGYYCNQGSLQPVLWDMLRQIETGEPSGAFGSPKRIDETA
jgi:hypothetical protein